MTAVVIDASALLALLNAESGGERVATARRLRLPALTADRAWLRLDIGVRVIAIR